MNGVIDTPELLSALLPRLRSADSVAMDTEADSLHSYPEKVCLIQFSLGDADLLVDPLSGMDLAPLWDALAGRELLLHGADYDLRMLHRTYRFIPDRIYDTMLAARLIGLREFGLSALVGSLLGIQLDKGPQKANWSRRPLTERMLAYACNDTHHLRALRAALDEKLVAAGRTDWHRQTCARLIEDCTQIDEKAREEAWRIKGSNRLSRKALALVRALWSWREQEARGANQPPFFVLSHDRLLAMAEDASRGDSIESLVPPRFSTRRRRGLAEAVNRALELPEAEWPFPLRHQGFRLTQAQKQRLEQLEAWRNRQADALGLEPSLIASRSTMVALAHDWERESAALMPWQREVLARPTHRPIHERGPSHGG